MSTAVLKAYFPMHLKYLWNVLEGGLCKPIDHGGHRERRRLFGQTSFRQTNAGQAVFATINLNLTNRRLAAFQFPPITELQLKMKKKAQKQLLYST